MYKNCRRRAIPVCYFLTNLEELELYLKRAFLIRSFIINILERVLDGILISRIRKHSMKRSNGLSYILARIFKQGVLINSW